MTLAAQFSTSVAELISPMPFSQETAAPAIEIEPLKQHSYLYRSNGYSTIEQNYSNIEQNFNSFFQALTLKDPKAIFKP